MLGEATLGIYIHRNHLAAKPQLNVSAPSQKPHPMLVTKITSIHDTQPWHHEDNVTLTDATLTTNVTDNY